MSPSLLLAAGKEKKEFNLLFLELQLMGISLYKRLHNKHFEIMQYFQNHL